MKNDISCRSGIVESVENDVAKIRIIQQSACSGCHAGTACSASDTEEKYIEVPLTGRDLSAGQTVEITGEKSMGLRASFWAYLLPALLIIASLLLCSFFNLSDLISALISLLALTVYYIFLYLNRTMFAGKFRFKLKS